jgi:hypothetical protein
LQWPCQGAFIARPQLAGGGAGILPGVRGRGWGWPVARFLLCRLRNIAGPGCYAGAPLGAGATVALAHLLWGRVVTLAHH